MVLEVAQEASPTSRVFASEINGVMDPAHTVAGHLDDDNAGILGAYGAFRD